MKSPLGEVLKLLNVRIACRNGDGTGSLDRPSEVRCQVPSLCGRGWQTFPVKGQVVNSKVLGPYTVFHKHTTLPS